MGACSIAGSICSTVQQHCNPCYVATQLLHDGLSQNFFLIIGVGKQEKRSTWFPIVRPEKGGGHGGSGVDKQRDSRGGYLSKILNVPSVVMCNDIIKQHY